MNMSFRNRVVLLLMGMSVIVTLSAHINAQYDCGVVNGPPPVPFTDAGDMGSYFCAKIAQVYFMGITSGTSATTYAPLDNVNRGQMAVFLARTTDASLSRGSRRAALGQWWTPGNANAIQSIALTSIAAYVASDGADVWVSIVGNNTVARVRASDGKI